MANSKRAHYEYDGGPLFANDVGIDENEVMDAISEDGRVREIDVTLNEECTV